ncbi:hypothetical protein ACX8XN_07070 [Calditrichota bacterium GD2]
MFSRNPFLRLPKSLWRVVKINQDGALSVKEVSTAPRIEEIVAFNDWRPLQKKVEELSAAFIDVLWIEGAPPTELTADTLIKIMNSDSKILFNEEVKPMLESLVQGSGFKFLKRIKTRNNIAHLVFKKDIIPCCGS